MGTRVGVLLGFGVGKERGKSIMLSTMIWCLEVFHQKRAFFFFSPGGRRHRLVGQLLLKKRKDQINKERDHGQDLTITKARDKSSLQSQLPWSSMEWVTRSLSTCYEPAVEETGRLCLAPKYCTW